MMQKLKDAQERWLGALESGNYRQGRAMLREGDKFCCLGVACDVLKDDVGLSWEYCCGLWYVDNHQTTVPSEIVTELQLYGWDGQINGERTSLAYFNDNKSWTFAEIAAFIRANPEKVFRNSPVEGSAL